MVTFANKPDQMFDITRSDGVRFIGSMFSPNGMVYAAFPTGPGFFVTAGDDVWGSVPVGKFPNRASADAACSTFVMPAREKRA